MTEEVERLRLSLAQLEPILNDLELELTDDPNWSTPSDTSYLSVQELADPDIAANVEAMAETSALISWFGRDRLGHVGLWQGPSGRPVNQAPVVRLDTEGQYDLIAATVGDYLAVSADHDDFEKNRALLIEAGFRVAESPVAVWTLLEHFDSPNEFRHRLYNEGRGRRGLPPIPPLQ